MPEGDKKDEVKRTEPKRRRTRAVDSILDEADGDKVLARDLRNRRIVGSSDPRDR